MGLPLFDKGFVNFTVEKSYGNFTQYGGCDERVCNPDGSPTTDPAARLVAAFRLPSPRK